MMKGKQIGFRITASYAMYYLMAFQQLTVAC